MPTPEGYIEEIPARREAGNGPRRDGDRSSEHRNSGNNVGRRR